MDDEEFEVWQRNRQHQRWFRRIVQFVLPIFMILYTFQLPLYSYNTENDRRSSTTTQQTRHDSITTTTTTTSFVGKQSSSSSSSLLSNSNNNNNNNNNNATLSRLWTWSLPSTTTKVEDKEDSSSTLLLQDQFLQENALIEEEEDRKAHNDDDNDDENGLGSFWTVLANQQNHGHTCSAAFNISFPNLYREIQQLQQRQEADTFCQAEIEGGTEEEVEEDKRTDNDDMETTDNDATTAAATTTTTTSDPFGSNSSSKETINNRSSSTSSSTRIADCSNLPFPTSATLCPDEHKELVNTTTNTSNTTALSPPDSRNRRRRTAQKTRRCRCPSPLEAVRQPNDDHEPNSGVEKAYQRNVQWARGDQHEVVAALLPNATKDTNKTDTNSSNDAAAFVLPLTPPSLVFLGDSIVEQMSGQLFGEPIGRAMEIQQQFEQYFMNNNKHNWTALPLGVASDTVSWLLAHTSLVVSGESCFGVKLFLCVLSILLTNDDDDTKTNGLLYRLQNGELAERLRPRVWWILIGTNNLSHRCSRESTLMGILRVVQEVWDHVAGAAAGASSSSTSTIVVQGLLPRGAAHLENNTFWDAIQWINDRLACMASAFDLDSNTSAPRIVFYNGTRHFLTNDDKPIRVNRKRMKDFLHPSAEGFRYWAQDMIEFLQNTSLLPQQERKG